MQSDDKIILKNLGEQIRKLRKRAKLSHLELSNRADIEKSTVIRVESGKMNPSVTTLLKICTGLAVPINKLFKFLPKDYYKDSK